MSDTETVIPSDELDAPLPDETQEAEEAPPEEAQDGDEESPKEESTQETGETAADADGEDAAEEVKPRKRRNVQKRISELTRAKHEAVREAQQYKQQLDALQSSAPPAAEPKQDDFQSFDEFVVAKAEWRATATVRKELETLGRTVQENQQQSEQTARAADWETKVEDARDRYDDFDDVALDPDVPVTVAMATALAEEENGADIAYHLGSNIKLAREIAALSPTQAVLRIGKLSAKLAEKPKPKTTSAPDPVKTVKAKATPQKDPDKMSYDEYVRWRNKGNA